MASDPALLDAYRKQCRVFGPANAFLLWLGQAGIEKEDMIQIGFDVLKEQETTQDD